MTKSSYRRCLDAIQKDSSTPDSVKQELKKLLKENDNGTSSPAVSSNTYHLHQGDNSFAFVNSTNYGANMVGKEGPGDTTTTTTTEPRSEGSVLGKRGYASVTRTTCPNSGDDVQRAGFERATKDSRADYAQRF
ncbi:hypothetical protein BDB00DRAFT_150322 [Zychaea mexicana]|uniref:uncharacterized protein n=1 Tax=Zychaea mexicana TaxID=64656 RepID=UPI0022FEA8C0|nr:uncharacterized protein BDB00DRAFT_150322 [Zychaea mexicana]KAI9484418.1 hypothetical protein BDB00DRAFT_150322 [Zychaea mexicana]